MQENEDEDASHRAITVRSERDEPTVVLRKRPRSRPVVMSRTSTLTLTVLKGQHTGQIVELRQGSLVVGRSKWVDLYLGDRGVSRTHARLTIDAVGRVELLDMGSTNGTFVNGERVLQEYLRMGDRIRVGLEAVLELGQAPTGERESDAPVPRSRRPTDSELQGAEQAPDAARLDLAIPCWGYSEAAIDAYTRLLDIRRKRLGHRHPSVAEMLETMGVALIDSGDVGRALECLDQALEIYEAQQPPALRAAGRTLAHIATGELALGRSQAAVMRLERAELLLRDAPDAPPLELGCVRLSLSQALWSLDGDPVRTAKLARLARDVFAAGGSATQMLHQEAQAWLCRVGEKLAERTS
jgi:pSer/pThr/pTyr-binding forkhead associated (FHA) protein